MFNLITVIIAIALTVVLIAVSVYYGGSITGDQKTKAEAVQYRNEASQIAGAVALYRAHGGTFSPEFTLQTLVDGEYLRDLPSGWEPGQDSIVRVLDPNDPNAESICLEANNQAGFKFTPGDQDVVAYSKDTTKGIPSCLMTDLAPAVPCCSNPS